ncbi:glycoside hydrolase family 3 N-terminal domain-containing protein [Arthrobacter sp. A2-55]|uniref:glycoside hydrolase family 3 N-terminal domain-containing protein n=1 Tax=Arthrobacter sp. A2-55 TaxID=2897337 RepID=UPI0021CD1B55|nr:glycoside hydrolase family 3 N-terminal domain-containing protein [Arthrobacter sp. A2-55]MCU6481908.1 glycoside hydrolase family 3 protein [Arthrobacter sp. A2-55]
MTTRARWWWGAAAAAAVLAVGLVLALLFIPHPAPPSVQASMSPSASASSNASAGASAGSTTAAGTTAAPVPTTAPPPPTSATPPPASGPAQGSPAVQKLAAMTLAQKVGQVLMVSSPVTGADANSLYSLDSLHVGNVFMKGRSFAGVDGIAAAVSSVTAHVGPGTAGVRPFVATDQEGGFVQIMRGPGFDAIPQAIVQGQLPPGELQADATRWGQQLAAAGVNVNLAPVLDTVPGAAFAPQNAPIGAFGREYGYTPAAVSSHGVAFARGMLAAGVNPTVKHFPGLGRVIGNTDVTAGVTDSVTVRGDAYVQPFRDAVNAGVPWLMLSNAYYPNIDPAQLAPYSTVIIQGMVRGDLGFRGIIVSDDMCDAVQVSGVPIAERGVDFIAAGGTMALCTDQALLPQMYAGLVAAAQSDPAFAAKVDAAALAVLNAKSAAGLLGK